MTKKNKFKYIKEYLITMLVCSLIVVAISFCVELELLFRTELKVNEQELNTDNLSKFCTIEELEKRLAQEPTNYAINIRLAMIYESLHKYAKANEYYQNALKLSGRSNYSLYSYAMFCAKRGLYGISSALAEEIKGNNLKTIQYRAKIYDAIGDSLYNANDYSAASKAYQVAYKYAKNMNDRDKYSDIKSKFANSYAKSADLHMEKAMIQEAILDLENSLRIKKNALASYKLALIYKDIDKVKAQKHMQDAFRANPFIVNPYIYNSLFEDLIEDAKLTGNQNALNLYSVKHEIFKKQITRSYVYKNDILIDNSYISHQKKMFSDDDKYVLIFDLKNNTKFTIDELHIEIELFINSKRYVLNKKIISYKNPLDAYDIMQKVTIELPNDVGFINVKDKNDITAKYFVKKTKKAPWTMAKIEFLNF